MGAVTLELDRPRRLRFDINALADVEDRLRIGLAGLFRTGDFRLSDVRLLLWAGLRTDDDKLTLEDTGALIHEHIRAGGKLSDVTEKIFDGFRECGLLEAEKKNQQDKVTKLSETG